MSGADLRSFVLALAAAATVWMFIENTFRTKGVPLPSEPFRIVGSVAVFCLVQTLIEGFDYLTRRA